jgi:DNA-binding MarR family transcriptional regulator
MDEADVRRLREQLNTFQRRQRRLLVAHDGLTQTAVRVLGSIARGPDGSQPGLIADELGLTSSNVAAALRELEIRHLITRSKDERDARRINLHLTPAGGAVVGTSRNERDGWLSKAIDAVLDQDQQAKLLEAGTILEQLSRFDGTAGPPDAVGS